jgi:hypothetical protein
MAFLIQNWCRASASANEPLYSLASSVIVGCFREYNYYTADSQATASASGYFNLGVAYSGVANDIVTGDYVNVYSSADGNKVEYRLTNTAGVITSAIAAGSYSVSATLSLTAAQFIAGYAAPILALAAPGANRMITNVSAAFAMTYGSAQFAAGGAVGFQYGNTANLGGTKVTTTLAGATLDGLTASSAWTLIPAVVAPVATATGVNAGVYLSNDTAAFTTGTGATFVIQVRGNVVATA